MTKVCCLDSSLTSYSATGILKHSQVRSPEDQEIVLIAVHFDCGLK